MKRTSIGLLVLFFGLVTGLTSCKRRSAEQALREEWKAGTPWGDAYDISTVNSHQVIVVDVQTGDVFYYRVNAFGSLKEKTLLFNVNRYTQP